jgi:hypothetical protein
MMIKILEAVVRKIIIDYHGMIVSSIRPSDRISQSGWVNA